MLKDGIEYYEPEVTLLHASPLWVAEVAGRTAYNSFANSEHEAIRNFPTMGYNSEKDIDSSEILTSLAWVHHHHSVIELIDISFSIKGTSRGVLQEHARHRIQSLTVQSTRYTMSSVLNAYIASFLLWGEVSTPTAKGLFADRLAELDTLIFKDPEMIRLEADAIYDKLTSHISRGLIAFSDMVSKEGMDVVTTALPQEDIFILLERCKKKRNVGDKFKYIVTDNWKVDMVVKFNLRSLKNYLDLRASGAAYWQIDMLAKTMIDVIPAKYLDLIRKKK